MTNRDWQRRGDSWAVVSALATGVGLIAAKASLADISPVTMNAYMFFMGAGVLLVEAFVVGKARQTLCMERPQLLFTLILSVLFAAALFLFYNGLALAEPATVSFLSRVELVATLFLAAFFLKERVSLAESAGLVLVAAGILVMRYHASAELSRAVVLVVTASVLTGIAEVALKARIDWIDFRSFIFYRNLFLAAIFAAAGLATGTIAWVSDGRILALLAAAAFLMPYLGRLGYLKAMQYIKISRAAIIVQCQPFLTAGAALALLGTFPPARELIGGILIVAGVVLIRLLEAFSKKR